MGRSLYGGCLGCNDVGGLMVATLTGGGGGILKMNYKRGWGGGGLGVVFRYGS